MPILAPAEGPLLEQILDGTHEIWHGGLDRQAHGRYHAAQLATAWGRAHLERWALVEDDQVLSSAKIYDLAGVLDGRAIRLAGISAVFTPPAHRGRGAARDLVSRLIDRAAADGGDAALLFSAIGPDYYARLGFEVVPTRDLTVRVIEDARRGAPATMVRAGDERDLADVVAMDAVRAAPYRFHLTRDRDLVQFALVKRRLLAGFAPLGARALQFFVAEEGASAVAYVAIAVNGSDWTIDSCGDRDPSGARLGAILQVLIARDPGEPRPTLTGWLPSSLHPPQLEITAAPSSRTMMLRALSDRGRPDPALAVEDVLYVKADEF